MVDHKVVWFAGDNQNHIIMMENAIIMNIFIYHRHKCDKWEKETFTCISFATYLKKNSYFEVEQAQAVFPFYGFYEDDQVLFGDCEEYVNKLGSGGLQFRFLFFSFSFSRMLHKSRY